MKLKSIQVENYRSIEDSEKFAIDDITCLVGKNESGKTAILKAIEGINPFNKDTKYDKTIDYPRRHLNSYNEIHEDKAAKVCTSEWVLNEQEVLALEMEFGDDCLESRDIVIHTYYDNVKTWNIKLNEKGIIEHLCQKRRLNAPESSVIKSCNSVREVYQKLSSQDVTSDKLNEIKKQIEGYRGQSVTCKAIDLLNQHLPTFVYFSHYSRMSGAVSVQQYREDEENECVSEENKVFADFLAFAGTSLDEVENADKHEAFKSKLEAASNSITDQIFEYWQQNANLEIEFDVSEGKPNDPAPFNEGTIMRARVKNTIHRASVPFSERSAGFIWFFSFLVHFSQVKSHYSGQKTNVIVLLDEPGLTLHAKAQYDLLRYIEEKLSCDHQVIYSTHSPFMIIPEKMESIRTVEDVVKNVPGKRREIFGTKVSSDFIKTSRDTIFPLQSALGYEISQTLFLGKKVILVEGASDVLYLKTISNILKEKGNANIENWVLCPTGSIDKIYPFVSLFLSHGEKREIVVITDYQHGHKNKVQKLRDFDKEMKLLLYSDFCDKKEADVEDMFEKSLYLDILKKSNDVGIDPEKINDENRIVKEIEAQVDKFSHYSPADWLIRNSDVLREDDKAVNKTLDRFKKLFGKVIENK